MFKKNYKAIITVEQKGEVKSASGKVTGEPLPVQLTTPVSVERLTVVRTASGIVVALGNDNEIINVEIKG